MDSSQKRELTIRRVKPLRSQTDSPQGTNMAAPKWEEGGDHPPGRTREAGKPKPQAWAVSAKSSLELRATQGPRGLADGVLRVLKHGVLKVRPATAGPEAERDGEREMWGRRAYPQTLARHWAAPRSRGGSREGGEAAGGGDQAGRGTAPSPGWPAPFRNNCWAPPPRSLASCLPPA